MLTQPLPLYDGHHDFPSSSPRWACADISSLLSLYKYESYPVCVCVCDRVLMYIEIYTTTAAARLRWIFIQLMVICEVVGEPKPEV